MAGRRQIYDVVAAQRAAKQQADSAAAKQALAQQKEERLAQGQAQTQNLNQQKFSWQQAHSAAQDELANHREALNSAVKLYQVTQEAVKMQRETRALMDAAKFQSEYSKIDKYDPDRGQKLAVLHEAFPEARLNQGVNQMIQDDNKDLADFQKPMTKTDLEYLKTYAPGSKNEKTLIAAAAKDDAAAMQVGQLWNMRKRAVGMQPEQDPSAYVANIRASLGGTPTEQAPPTATPAPTAAPVPEVPAASTPKEQQTSDWAKAQAPVAAAAPAPAAAAAAASPTPTPATSPTPDEQAARDYLNKAFNGQQ